VQGLMRRLDDTRATIWSSDFSDTLGRSQYELESVLEDLAPITQSKAVERAVKHAPQPDSYVGDLARIEGDWPYLAF
jgi:hypothetical protein